MNFESAFTEKWGFGEWIIVLWAAFCPPVWLYVLIFGGGDWDVAIVFANLFGVGFLVAVLNAWFGFKLFEKRKYIGKS